MNPAPATATRPHNGFNQLLSVSGAAGGLTSFTYDGNGNQVTRADAAGTTTYAYNLDNRLVGVAAPGGVSTFEYDANGLRTKKSDSTGTRSYLLDGLSVVAEYAPDASRLAWYTQSLARIDEVLNVVNGQGKYWYETDALGSTYAMTNATGAVVSRSSYDVFGERAVVSANDVVQPFGFTGREQDQSGLVYARARYLSPYTGRWDRADPLGQAAGPNYFAYVNASPTRLSDPSGLMFATTLDAYAWSFPLAFIMLAKDLGARLPDVLMVAGTAVALTATISMNRSSASSRERAKTDTLCEPMPAPPRYATYYRGLSKDDLSEYLSQGVVRSKFYRYELGVIMDGLQRAVDWDTAVRHVASGSESDTWASPLVSVTTDWMQARSFANNGPQASGVTVRFETGRTPMYKGLTKDEEWLFFWQLGFPGEQLTIAN